MYYSELLSHRVRVTEPVSHQEPGAQPQCSEFRRNDLNGIPLALGWPQAHWQPQGPGPACSTATAVTVTQWHNVVKVMSKI
jgi:hypothetical protein